MVSNVNEWLRYQDLVAKGLEFEAMAKFNYERHLLHILNGQS